MANVLAGLLPVLGAPSKRTPPVGLDMDLAQRLLVLLGMRRGRGGGCLLLGPELGGDPVGDAGVVPAALGTGVLVQRVRVDLSATAFAVASAFWDLISSGAAWWVASCLNPLDVSKLRKRTSISLLLIGSDGKVAKDADGKTLRVKTRGLEAA